MADCASSQSTAVEKTETNPRFDWYQSEQQVVLTVFVKNIKANCSSVIFADSEVGMVLVTDNELKVTRTFPLERNINPSRSSYKIYPSKLEIKLIKSDGTHWPNLEKVPQSSTVKKPEPRNWDKVVSDLDADKSKEDDVNDLFRKIYGDGSDEVKKAMIKSFVESGGTELNTNWGAVKKDKVSVKPPDGLEWRSWDK